MVLEVIDKFISHIQRTGPIHSFVKYGYSASEIQTNFRPENRDSTRSCIFTPSRVPINNSDSRKRVWKDGPRIQVPVNFVLGSDSSVQEGRHKIGRSHNSVRTGLIPTLANKNGQKNLYMLNIRTWIAVYNTRTREPKQEKDMISAGIELAIRVSAGPWPNHSHPFPPPPQCGIAYTSHCSILYP
jgi:hypothetical protein